MKCFTCGAPDFFKCVHGLGLDVDTDEMVSPVTGHVNQAAVVRLKEAIFHINNARQQVLDCDELLLPAETHALTAAVAAELQKSRDRLADLMGLA